MTRLIKTEDLIDILGTESKLYWTKEDYSIHDTFIAQDEVSETKYKIDGILEGIPQIKTGWRMFILSEPTPSN